MSIREFYGQPNNVLLAKAEIGDQYQLGGMINNQFQSEHVPFTWSGHAIDAQRHISIFFISEEKFFDYRTQLLKQSVNMNPNIIRSSLRDYTRPEDYIRAFAESIFDGKLELQATAQSPTRYSMNLQGQYNQLGTLANYLAGNEASMGYPCEIRNLTCTSYLFKYRGYKGDQEYTVLAACDFEGFETAYQQQMTAIFNNFFGVNSNAGQNTRKSDVLGEGGGDIIEWGSKFRYLMIAPKTEEADGARDFLKFLNTFEMDPNLTSQFVSMIEQRVQQQMMQTAQYQAQTRVNISNNIFQQQKLTNMLNQNAQSISNGIMDSWNRKMASDSRISNNFSEAIRGVNTYTTTDGRNVEVGVSADHVYQNQHGDVYGVSGNAIDDDVLNRINWTEIHKK
ncbi:MAG: hypothetical protein J6S49_09540 [Erysipelotrichaceae bacterium]|nr:hypothetical protein [Erysipelotrichaceae bacterium]